MLPQTRFQASGSPGTIFEVPGDGSQRRRQAILTKLSAKAALGLAKCKRLSIKSTIGDTKHTIPSETVSKMKDLKPPGETWAGEAKFLENGRVPNPL